MITNNNQTLSGSGNGHIHLQFWCWSVTNPRFSRSQLTFIWLKSSDQSLRGWCELVILHHLYIQGYMWRVGSTCMTVCRKCVYVLCMYTCKQIKIITLTTLTFIDGMNCNNPMCTFIVRLDVPVPCIIWSENCNLHTW